MTAIQKAREALIAARESFRTGRGQLSASNMILDALAALDAETEATPADVGEEPVAWRWRPQGGTVWVVWEAKPVPGGNLIEDAVAEIEPLYSATALERVVRENATLRARLETVEAETRERIAAALDEEADLIPCAEDAMVTRSNARLVRANFSYEDAERIEAEEDAAAIRNLEPRHD